MFYIVPAGKSLDHIMETTESFVAARFHANFLKKTRDEDYDIIEMRRYASENINDPHVLHHGGPEIRFVDGD